MNLFEESSHFLAFFCGRVRVVWIRRFAWRETVVVVLGFGLLRGGIRGGGGFCDQVVDVFLFDFGALPRRRAFLRWRNIFCCRCLGWSIWDSRDST
jgi:hypothetical protein